MAATLYSSPEIDQILERAFAIIESRINNFGSDDPEPVMVMRRDMMEKFASIKEGIGDLAEFAKVPICTVETAFRKRHGIATVQIGF